MPWYVNAAIIGWLALMSAVCHDSPIARRVFMGAALGWTIGYLSYLTLN